MSLWTPGGEHTPQEEPQPPQPGETEVDPRIADLSPEDRARYEQMQHEMADVRAQLLAAPAAVVVANHAMGLYELAAIHLTASEPKLEQASLAIDALEAITQGLAGRLGEAEPTLTEGLMQLKAAYLDVRNSP